MHKKLDNDTISFNNVHKTEIKKKKVTFILEAIVLSPYPVILILGKTLY